MHDSIVGRNGARWCTRPGLESGVTGSSGSLSNGLGTAPSSQPSLLLCGRRATSQRADHCQASHRCNGSRHFQPSPTVWYRQVGRNIGPAPLSMTLWILGSLHGTTQDRQPCL
jgi:hypothetical protein